MRQWIVVVAWCGLLCPIAPAEAQRPIAIGVGGGVSIPSGDLGDGVDPGWHALGTLALGTLMQPIGLRLDVAYHRFAFSDERQEALGDEGNQTIGSATLNASYRLPMTDSPVSPYLIAGLGAYRTQCSLDPGCEGITRFGWNAGLGTRLYLLGVRSFVETRYHRTSREDVAVQFIPVTLGIVF